VKILDTVTLVFFVLVAVGLIGFGWTILATYMTPLVNLTLMGIAWGSLLAGTPFTIQYARAGPAGAVACATLHPYQSVHHRRLGPRLLSLWASFALSTRSR
jgi:hypothetical protein